MTEELRTHLELQTQQNIARGMSPEEAVYAARRSFGGMEQIKEQAREQRRWMWLEQFRQDVRNGLRALGKNPGFTIVIVLSLALGIGANSAVFSRVNERLLRMLPVKNPGELVLFQWLPGPQGGGPTSDGGDNGFDNIDRETGQPTRRLFSSRTFEAFRSESAALAELFAVAPVWSANVRVDEQTERVGMAQVVSDNYYTTLGVSAFLGRTLQPEDHQAGAAPVAVISHRYWRAHFAANPAAIGRTIIVNQVPATIVGVTSADFRDTISDGEVDITMPLAVAPRIRFEQEELAKPGHWWLRLTGRLKPGATIEQARASLEGSFRTTAREGMRPKDVNDLPRLRAVSGGFGSTEAERQHEADLLKIEIGITALVLLAACVNVANLLLARGAARRREFALRLALGASRGRLVRQLLTESLLLGCLGAALSTCFALWSVDLLSALSIGEKAPPFNGRILGFTILVAVLASMAFGLVPALRATRLDLTAEFQGGRGQMGGGRSWLGRTLVILQVTLSLVLLVGAGLFIRTVSNLRAVDVGFDRSRLVLFSVDASWTGYSQTLANALNDRVAERIAELPGVDGVTFAGWSILTSMGGFQIGVSIPGYSPPAGERVIVKLAPITANYFQTYRITVLAGRTFEPRDGTTGPKVAIINRTFARKYFGEENPVGKTIRQGRDEREIVGVVADVKQEDLRVPAAPILFVPLVQSGNGPRTRATFFTVRTAQEPTPMIAAIRTAVREMDSNLPVINLRTQNEVVERRLLSSERLFARMSVFLGLLALALACVGLHGLMSYTVHRRTGEIGVRIALGALSQTVLTMILRESLSLVLLGIGLGLAAAAGATRLVGHLLYGLSPTDAPTYAAGALILLLVASVAALMPARRAAKIDPMVALRAE